MKVWVVMGNDYPDAVFNTEEAAEAFIALKKSSSNYNQRIYWRTYAFEVQQ